MDKNRRKFLRLSGSFAVGGAFFSVVGTSLWRMFTHPERMFYDSRRNKAPELMKEDGSFVSPYRRTFGFVVPDEILAFDVEGGSLFVATSGHLYKYGISGEVQKEFAMPTDLRDIALYGGLIYALYPTSIQVYDGDGALCRQWDACSDNSDYCCLAVCAEGIFVTDTANKNICKYTLDGTLSRFMNSPQGFIIPGNTFPIICMDGQVFCSNPGRHVVEQYTTDGDFVSSFGKPGAGAGAFCGCCNPVILAPAHNGELLTSEKGVPRISCYGREGVFRSVLLDARALGGGHDAYDVRMMKDKLVVVGGKKVSIFQYNHRRSQETACGQCDKDCPLKL